MPQEKPKQRPPVEQPTEVEMKPSTYQPNKAEKEEEQDMPGWAMEKVRAAFMRTFHVKSEEE